MVVDVKWGRGSFNGLVGAGWHTSTQEIDLSLLKEFTDISAVLCET